MNTMTSQAKEALLLSDAELYQEKLFSMLRSARSEILLEYYIYADDDFGRQLLQTLVTLANQGVKVKLLVDGFGSELWLKHQLNMLLPLPLEIRVYHPLPWSLPSLRHALRRSQDFVYCMGTLNRRNHRKLVVVDGQQAIIGSHNAWIESLQWHEASLLLGPACAEAVRASFERVWCRSSDLDGKRMRFALRRNRFSSIAPSKPEGGEILDNTTLRRSRIRGRTILEPVAHAKTRLWITTPYLLPHRTLLRRIRERAEAGVDVKLVLPARNDVCFSRWIAQALYRELLESGVQIHEYTGGILHAKVMVMDDAFVLGSSNMNHRSFIQDLEIDYLGRNPAELQAIVQWTEETLARCERITSIGQVRLFHLKKCLAFLLNPVKDFF